MIEKVEGIILNTIDYKESSLILNVLTLKYGLIGIIAKGCKKPKSILISSCSKMTYGYFNIIYKEGKLSTLTSVDIIDYFKNIRKDLEKTSYAGFLLELTYQVVKQNNACDLYLLLRDALVKTNEGYDCSVIMNIIELKYLEYLGVMPILDSCYKCGATDIITVSNGGYICSECLTNEKIVSSKMIKLLRMFYYVDLGKITKINVSLEVKEEISNFLDNYYELYTGIYLKSKKFIEILKKNNV